MNSFLFTRQIYVLLFAIIACVTAAAWYPTKLVEVLSAVPRSFNVSDETVNQIVKTWVSFMKLPFPLTLGLLGASLGMIILSINFPPIMQKIPVWMFIYIYMLRFICGVMLIGGFYVFLGTLVLLRRLLSFKLRLVAYRNLVPLSNLSTGLTILGFVALALFILMVFDQINMLSIISLILGTFVAILMFIIPQLSYQSAVVNAKTEVRRQVGILYEAYYNVLNFKENNKQPTATDLNEAKEALEAFAVIEKSIKDIPNWLIEVSDMQRIIISVFAPISSILFSEILSQGFK